MKSDKNKNPENKVQWFIFVEYFRCFCCKNSIKIRLR